MKLTKPEEFFIRIKRLDMRHSQIAEKAGLSPSMLSLMMNGHMPFPKDIQKHVGDCLAGIEALKEGE